MKWVHVLLAGTLVLHFLLFIPWLFYSCWSSAEDSDVFVCEVAGDTPAPVSDAVSELPGESSKRGRTQHGRVAVGVEASVVYNDWENGTLNFHFHSALYALFVLCTFAHGAV